MKKTKLSPSWIAVVVILFIISVGALLEKQFVGFIFFLGVALWLTYAKANTAEESNPDTKEPFRKGSSLNELA